MGHAPAARLSVIWVGLNTDWHLPICCADEFGIERGYYDCGASVRISGHLSAKIALISRMHDSVVGQYKLGHLTHRARYRHGCRFDLDGSDGETDRIRNFGGPLGGLHQPAEYSKQRCLTAVRRSRNGDHLAGFNGEGDVAPKPTIVELEAEPIATNGHRLGLPNVIFLLPAPLAPCTTNERISSSRVSRAEKSKLLS